ncbi:plasmalemma vesicle associated protein b [Amia ocellicauda]|uniref:plasmalemma vesicle associated protein b n=1 Tax=Amia ocellicauda TaxID=2972642 RepID=UPI00346438A7
MYNSKYSMAKFGVEAKDIHASKGKNCGYYVKVVLFFSSLIQSLIIVGLVLFMIYGKPEVSVDEMRVQELEKNAAWLSTDRNLLKLQIRNVSNHLNRTEQAKKLNDLELLRAWKLVNDSSVLIRNLNQRMILIERQKKELEMACTRCKLQDTKCPADVEKMRLIQERDSLKLNVVNLTLISTTLQSDLNTASKDRDNFHLESISLRKKETDLKQQLDSFTKKCEDDIRHSLEGIQTITTSFQEKIRNLFAPSHAFSLTCEKQRAHLDSIRANCSTLSQDIENKFQPYLNSVSATVSRIESENSRLTVQNGRLSTEYKECSGNLSAAHKDTERRLKEQQNKHDHEVERLLREQTNLRGQVDLKDQTIKVQNNENLLLNSKIASLNASLANCIPKVSSYNYVPGSAVKPVDSFQNDMQKHMKAVMEFEKKMSGV